MSFETYFLIMYTVIPVINFSGLADLFVNTYDRLFLSINGRYWLINANSEEMATFKIASSVAAICPFFHIVALVLFLFGLFVAMMKQFYKFNEWVSDKLL